MVLSVLMAACLSLVVVYPDRVVPFARRNSYALLAVACCLFFVVVGIGAEAQSLHFSKTKGQAITYDEVSLLPNGYYYRANGTYFVNPEHPPLVKDIAALPFTFLNAKQPPVPLPKEVLFQDYAQYAWGKTFLFESGNNTEALIFWARSIVLLANAVLIFLLFWSLARLWSGRAGFIATFFLTVSQFTIAHASLVTVDVMSALFTLLTLVWFSAWLKRWRNDEPRRLALLLTSLCLAGAICAKFSTILLVPVMGLLYIGYGLAVRKQLGARSSKFARAGIGLFMLALVFVVVFYAWHVRHMAAVDIIAQLHHSYNTQRLPKFGLTLLDATSHWGVFGRAFAEVGHGLLMVNNRIYNGAGGVYFMGHWYGPEGAGPLYFPLLYLTKLQPLYLLLSAASLGGLIWICIKTKTKHIRRVITTHPLPLVLGVYAGVFAGIAIMSRLQIGLRHIFPVIMAIMVLSALALDVLVSKWQASRQYRRYLPWALGVIAAWMVGSVLWSFPYYLSYYNVFAGGTNNGYKLATDSNYDWGQDVKALAAWQQQHDVANLHFDLFTNPFLPIRYYLGDQAQPYDVATDRPLPPGSFLAVSIHNYEINTHRELPKDRQYSQFDADQVGRAGKTIFIYKIPNK